MSDLTKRAQEVGFNRAALEAGATITDGPLREFKGGWACAPLLGKRVLAHYWEVQATRTDSVEFTPARSACGLDHGFTARVPFMAPGNAPFCARCENKLMGKVRNTR
jgi:hypothetical protein